MQKSPDAFRTISEVASDLDVPQHVLRFWETRFSTIRPLKRGGGRRYYRPDDVELLKGIRQLLYGQGYTIRGVQRILKEDGARFVQAVGRGEQQALSAPPDDQDDGLDAATEFETSSYDHEPVSFSAASGPSPARHDDDQAGPPHQRAPDRQAPGLSPDILDRLRAAVDELRECERILGTLRTQ